MVAIINARPLVCEAEHGVADRRHDEPRHDHLLYAVLVGEPAHGDAEDCARDAPEAGDVAQLHGGGSEFCDVDRLVLLGEGGREVAHDEPRHVGLVRRLLSPEELQPSPDDAAH